MRSGDCLFYYECHKQIIDKITFEADMRCPDGAVEPYIPTNFEWWRETHKVHRQPAGDALRCPRCYSPRIKIDENYAKCLSCLYSVYLWDFPETRGIK